MRPMTLEQFDHICRAAAALADVKRVHVFGENAIIPWLVKFEFPVPSPNFSPCLGLEITTGVKRLDKLVDDTIGLLSKFEERFFIYAIPTSLSSFQAPQNWRERTIVRIEPQHGVEIVAPHPHDLIAVGLTSGDFHFATAAAKLFPISDAILKQLVEEFGRSVPEAVQFLRKNIEVWWSKRHLGPV